LQCRSVEQRLSISQSSASSEVSAQSDIGFDRCRNAASLGSIADRLYLPLPVKGEAKMLRSVSAFALVLLMGAPAFADGMEVSRPRYRHYGIYLPPERHVIEVVRPPYSANFIINGARFVGQSPACWSWAAGERIKLLAGDWNGRCSYAVFYNFYRRSTCEMLCGGSRW
jgi:hypothetical protein